MEFKKEYEIRISDINPGNHVGHDQFLSLLHDARCHFFMNLKGIDHSCIHSNKMSLIETCISGKNIGIILNELNVKYRSELFYPEKILIKIHISEITKISFQMNYSVLKLETGTLVLEASMKLISFDYENKKPVKFSENFLNSINEYLIQ